ncbi:helix-hairpin-helix domain-containing protein [Crinalium epipsammum]|nr:helix-hairpin-helix domain-containing protein [Crinalium epipsammum]
MDTQSILLNQPQGEIVEVKSVKFEPSYDSPKLGGVAETEITDYKIQTARCGKIRVLVSLKQVELDGQMIAGAIVDIGAIHHNICVGEQIHLCKYTYERFGDHCEQPKFYLYLLRSDNYGKHSQFSIPEECPACKQSILKLEHDQPRCINTDCSSILPSMIRYWQPWIYYQLDYELINNLINQCEIKSLADLYRLKLEDFTNKANFEPEIAQKLLTELNNSRNYPWWKVLYSLRIRYVSVTEAKHLTKQFSSSEELLQADLDQLKLINNISEEIAESVYSWIILPSNRKLIQRLKTIGLKTSDKKNIFRETLKSVASEILQTIWNYIHEIRSKHCHQMSEQDLYKIENFESIAYEIDAQLKIDNLNIQQINLLIINLEKVNSSLSGLNRIEYFPSNTRFHEQIQSLILQGRNLLSVNESPVRSKTVSLTPDTINVFANHSKNQTDYLSNIYFPLAEKIEQSQISILQNQEQLIKNCINDYLTEEKLKIQKKESNLFAVQLELESTRNELKILRDENEKLALQNTQFSQERNDLLEQIKQLESQLSLANKEKHNLKSLLLQIQKENSKSFKEIQVQLKQIPEYNNQSSILLKLQEAQDGNATLLQDFGSQLDRIHQSTSQFKSQVEELQNQNSSLHSELDQTKQKLTEAQHRINELEDNNQLLKFEDQEKQIKLEEINEQLSQSQHQNSQLLSELQQSREEYNHLYKKRQDLQTQLQCINQSLQRQLFDESSQLSPYIQLLTEQLAVIYNQVIDDTQSLTSELKAEISVIRQQLEQPQTAPPELLKSLKEIQTNLLLQLSDSQNQLRQTQQERDIFPTELNRVTTELKQVCDQLELSEQNRLQLQNQLSETSGKLEKAQLETVQLQTQLAEVQLQLKQYQEQTAHYQTECKQLQQDLANTEEKLQQTQLELQNISEGLQGFINRMFQIDRKVKQNLKNFIYKEQ